MFGFTRLPARLNTEELKGYITYVLLVEAVKPHTIEWQRLVWYVS
jgi:hypothetical protein